MLGLAVLGALVLELHPGEGGLVEQAESQVGLTFEHGEQPALDLAPEHLLLAILMRGVRERGVVHDTEAL